MTELEHAIKHIKTRADAWAVKEVTEALQSISERLDKALSQEPCRVKNELKVELNELEPCGDAVSRQAVMNIVKDMHGLARADVLSDAVKRLKDLPPVKQKSGKWIDYSDVGYVECPFCGHATTCEDNIDELHYCFYCGAKMESEDKE